MTTEMTVQKKTEMALVENQTHGMIATDVIVPRLLLMQGTSDFVKERKAGLGDMVRSTDAKVLGNPDGSIDFIPLSLPTAAWITECRAAGAQRWEFRGMSPRTAANDNLPWKYTADKDGKILPDGTPSSHEWRRVKTLSLYALLPADIEAEAEEMKRAENGEMPDLSKALTPIQISFRSTGFNAGKEVTSFFAQAAQFNQPAWKYMLKLGCVLENNDQGSYYVFKVDRVKPALVKKEHLPTVMKWASIVATQNLRVDDTAEDSAAEAPASTNY